MPKSPRIPTPLRLAAGQTPFSPILHHTSESSSFAPLIEAYHHNGAEHLEGGRVKGLGEEQRKEEEEQNFVKFRSLPELTPGCQIPVAHFRSRSESKPSTYQKPDAPLNRIVL